MELVTIGRVCNGRQGRPESGWGDVVSRIVLRRRYLGATEGLSDYSHILVLCWLHRVDETGRQTLRVHPMGRRDLPEVGVFGTRSRRRPNPISVTTCRLLRQQGVELVVQGLDMVDATPVIDIKGNVKSEPGEVRMPNWVSKL